ncbi:anaphase-promoting complex subunit 15-like isoform X1 [Argonauta hians]
MSRPLFPSLVPKAVDPFWFPVDKPCLDESEISALEADYNNWAQSVGDKDNAIVPIGKTAQEHYDEEEEEEEEEEVDDESDTNDDELDTDMVDDRDSTEDFDFRGRRNSLNLVDMDAQVTAGSSPMWGV